MGLQVKNLTDLVIASSGQNSNTLGLDKLRDSEFITIYSPSALTGTVTVYASQDNSTFLQVIDESGSAVTLAASKATTFQMAGYNYLRIQSDAAEAAERTFNASKLVRDSRHL
jgi:phage terminase large subunit GpA-like protein